MRVLYVDDDRINSMLFAELARWLGGFEVELAACGAEAHAVIADWTPELLVIDLHLPDTDGHALLQSLRASAPCLCDVPAVLCTAEDPRDVGEQACAAGFSACWTKPVDRELLLAMRERTRTQVAPS